jgi:pimeloyl-ACP methyl ester carboxylesterase
MVDSVVLLHGAGRSPRSMRRIEKALSQHSYQVHNLGYPSRSATIEELANHIEEQIRYIQRHTETKTHFVTHSLGGIILRCFLRSKQPSNIGRVVMLAPPNQGAVLADYFGGYSLFQWILGPVGAQIGTGSDSLPMSLGPVDYEVGVIAGNRSLNLLFSLLIPGPDDGRIAVDSTKLTGMTDFIVIPCIHPLIMFSASAINQTIHFLAHGYFQENKERSNSRACE